MLETLLELLAVDSAGCNAFRTVHWNLATFLWILLPPLAALGLGSFFDALPLLTVMAASIWPILASIVAAKDRALRVGSTLQIARALSTERVSIEDIADVEAVDHRKIRILRRGKSTIEVDLGVTQVLEGGQLVSVRDIVLQRIQRERARHVAVAPEAHGLTTRLARGGRAIGTWVDEIRSLRKAEGNYRTSSLPEADLWEVIDDRSAADDARAAAAVLLKRDTSNRERIRVAARVVESPRLRVALARVADATNDSFDSVLTRVAQ